MLAIDIIIETFKATLLNVAVLNMQHVIKSG